MFLPYYHGIIRKYIVSFGTLFNNLYINRVNSSNNVIQSFKVPLSYGPKEKFLSRADGDPELNRPFSMVLPRMAFELVTVAYDPERKLNTLNKTVAQNPNNPDQLYYQYQSVPYNLGITLDIMTKNTDDATRIVEQILPYFAPQWTVTMNLVPDLGLKVDVPIVLNTTSLQDTYEGDYINRRAIVWSLGFTMKAQLFGPIKKGQIIKQANTNFRTTTIEPIENAIGFAPINERVTITPGLLANGSPTTDSTLTVDKSQIKSTDNYDFIVDFDSISDTIT